MNDKEGQELYESISNSIEDKLGGSWQGNQVRIIIKEIVLKDKDNYFLLYQISLIPLFSN